MFGLGKPPAVEEAEPEHPQEQEPEAAPDDFQFIPFPDDIKAASEPVLEEEPQPDTEAAESPEAEAKPEELSDEIPEEYPETFPDNSPEASEAYISEEPPVYNDPLSWARPVEEAEPEPEPDFGLEELHLDPPVRRTNCTYFAEGTSMEGTLHADSDIEIVGDFKGEIASNGKVTIHANTNSTIAAADLELIDCTLTGDVVVSGTLTVNENSSITGNIRSGSVICSGVINGNLLVRDNIALLETALVVGDVRTGTLSMSRGARVSGKIDMGV